MILILSQDDDQSTADVIDWLYIKGVNFKRLNYQDIYFDFNLSYRLDERNEKLPVLKDYEIKAIWLRRWNKFLDDYKLFDRDESKLADSINRIMNLEASIFSEHFFEELKQRKWLTTPNQYTVNKLNVLNAAIKVGLKIPPTLVTSSQKDLKLFYEEFDGKIIVKPIDESRPLFYQNNAYFNYTTDFDIDDFKNQHFALTLFQKKIEKAFEVRVFYFFGKCLSMAIFSQEDENTKNDFREYNLTQPNRDSVFKFDKSMEIKIKRLMDRIGLDTGSLDFICNQSNDFIFLEVNPIGQFGMVSYPCNYFIEKEIANKLINFSDGKY